MYPTTNRAVHATLVILFAVSAAPAWGATPEKNIFGLSPEVASQLPGVPHLFQIRNASAPPQIAPGEKFKLGEVIAAFRSR
jgi:hypothetical protein